MVPLGERKICLVTGGNSGIGLEMLKHVISVNILILQLKIMV